MGVYEEKWNRLRGPWNFFECGIDRRGVDIYRSELL